MTPSAMRLVASAFVAFAPAILASDYDSTGYNGSNVPHGNATWNGHSVCFNYFLQKDDCVHGSIDHKCKDDGAGSTPQPAYNSPGSSIMKLSSYVQFGFQAVVSITQSSLQKRYDTTEPVEYVAGGDGICGNYETNTTFGACIWSGANYTDGSDPATAGWINGEFNSTCGKQLYVQRQGKPETVQYIPVLDGCNFNAVDPAEGCFQIYLTEAAFFKIATPDEIAQGHLDGVVSWDFNNLGGDHPWDAPL